MNEFIELRKSFCEENNPYVFLQLFFDKYIENNKNIKIEQENIIEKLQKLKDWGFKKILKAEDICEMLSALGDNDYLDRYISDIIINFFKNSEKTILENFIHIIINDRKYSDTEFYYLLDICIECNIKILDEDELLFILDKYKMEYDILSILIEYISIFKIDNFKNNIYNMLEYESPDNIKIQLLDLLSELYSVRELKEYLENPKIKLGLDKKLYMDYIEFFDRGFVTKEKGLIVMQSMFYGDFEDSGKGDNGGLAVFLKSLGNEMSKDKDIASIITITINQALDKPFMMYYTNKHLFIRLPIYIDMSKRDPFIKRELFIKRYIYRFLKRSNIKPDIFHIRYLDNASKAISILRKELGKKLVFTLTPDPHRNMFDRDGMLINFNFNEFMEKLNKIKIGDELLCDNEGIIGIGNIKVKNELDLYFPQLENSNITKKMKMIAEGIESDLFLDSKIEEEIMECIIDLTGIDKDFFTKPIILNVGRLNALKGQDNLLKAWGNSKLCNTHNLLIIGGDLENPNREEKFMMAYFKEYIDSNPHLNKSFFHIGAISNENITIIEKSIMKNHLNFPNIYICSSKKEEFGIAILEAMLKKFLIIAPINGGVKSYIKNGVNGFLIDTSSWESIAKETEKIIYDLKINKEEFEEIQMDGHKTVDELYSVEKIAKDFLSFYLSV